MKPITEQRVLTSRSWALLGLLGLIWGGSFPSTRAVLQELGFISTVAFRIGGGAIFLWIVIGLRGIPVTLTWRAAFGFLIVGALGNVLPFLLIAWGQQHIPSGLAAILNTATAILSVAIAAIVFADERLTARKVTGVLFGIAGVTTVIGLRNLASLDLTSLGQIAIIGASLSYAITGPLARILLAGVRPDVSAAGMLSASSLIMVPLALAREGIPSLDYTAVTWTAVIYLAVVASGVAYLLYYAVLRAAGAGNVSLVTLLVAPVSILLGALAFGETLDHSAYLGFALLAAGLLVIDGRILGLAGPGGIKKNS